MESVLEPLKEFSKNSLRLVKRCTKPDRRGEEYALRYHHSQLIACIVQTLCQRD